jgi:S-adenosylmethionine synthetase
VHLHAQSSDIARGVVKDEGAGDQGIMFGYACRETPELMPAPIFYAHRILKVMSQARRSGESQVLGPDAKGQVTIRYENGKPVEATQIVVSTQHFDENLSSFSGTIPCRPPAGSCGRRRSYCSGHPAER